MRAVAAAERRPEGRRRAVIGESTANAARRAVLQRNSRRAELHRFAIAERRTVGKCSERCGGALYMEVLSDFRKRALRCGVSDEPARRAAGFAAGRDRRRKGAEQ